MEKFSDSGALNLAPSGTGMLKMCPPQSPYTEILPLPGHLILGVVHFSVRVSQSFRRKDLGGWVVRKNLSERIVGSQKPVHLETQ